MRFKLPLLLSLALLVSSCASTPLQKAQQGSVNLHEVLAAVQDAELALCAKGTDGECHSAVPAWTTAKHREFNSHLVVALKAGKAVNEAVRTAPVSPADKLNLSTVSNEVGVLAGLVTGVLPPDSPTAKTISGAKDAILALLPLFLS
jgi:hypothetical protein